MCSDVSPCRVYQRQLQAKANRRKGFVYVCLRVSSRDGPRPLSGGQKQRVALARAFFGEPSMVVLDEPNSNLDAAGEQALTDTLLRAREMRVTTIVITQRPALLNIVDKVLILRAGRAEAFGPPKEVLRRLLNGKASPSQPADAAAKQPACPRPAEAAQKGDEAG